ncbi:Scr1 family TA system antitoxin-like transcriptional regulator [Streptomyces sp. NPDC050504]|uniref:helix-turn-helix domain-containing protein n=1 Tax=Streptomyces sp. NPDC050504 TaxID=3365618 RepID=UPI0037B44A18
MKEIEFSEVAAMKDSTSDENLNPLVSFGEDLRAIRVAKKMTMKTLGKHVGYSESYVSRIENGLLTPSPRFVNGCDQVFGMGDVLARQYKRLVSGLSPSWLAPFLEHERRAREVRDYSIGFLPGFAQTPAYAEAAFRATHPHEDAEQIAARVEERIKRRSILDRSPRPLVWLTIHESALRMVVGSPAVMAEQLEFLIALTESSHVVVQVYPFQVAVPATGKAFILLTVGGAQTYLYAEAVGRGVLSNASEEVHHWRRVFDRLCADAESPARSIRLITEMIEEYRA